MPKLISLTIATFLSASAAMGQAPIPAPGAAARVAADHRMDGAAAAWAPIASALKADPLFSRLGLDALKPQGGNAFLHKVVLSPAGISMSFQGTLRFDPSAKDGAPYATLLSVTTSPDSGRALDMGALHAVSAKLDVAILNQGGAPKLQARVLPSFVGMGPDGPYLTLTSVPNGIEYNLTGPSLRLADLVPGAKDIPSLKDLAVRGAAVAPGRFTVSGDLKGKPVALTVSFGSKEFGLTGDDLSLPDFIPESASIPLLRSFAVDRVAYSTSTLSVSGKAGGKALTVFRAAGTGNVTVSGEGLKLADFIPEAASVPVLSNFAFDRFAYAAGAASVWGRLNGKAVTASRTAADASFTMTGADLKLADFVPQAADLPLFKTFAFESMAASNAAVSVAGRVNTRELAVKVDLATKFYSVTGEDLTAPDFFPEAASMPILAKFAFESLSQSASGLVMTGRIDAKAVTVRRDAAGKNLVVTSESLKLSDLIPQAAGLPLLDRFAFTGYSRSAASVTVTGTIDGKAVSVSKDDAKDDVTVTGAGLKLSDLVPQASDLPVLSRFAFDRTSLTSARIVVAGKVAAASVAVTLDRGGQFFTVVSSGLKLADFVPAAASVPGLDLFALKSVSRGSAKTTVSGAINGRNASVSVDSGKDALTVTGDDLTLSVFIPEAAGVPVLKQFAFQSMTRSTASLVVAGTLNGKSLTVTRSDADKTFTVAGADLKASDLVPEAASLPLLKSFDFDSFTGSPSGIVVTGKVDGKAVSVRRSKNGQSLSVSGDGLKAADFIPQAAGLPLLDRFAFTGYSRSTSSVTMTGTIDGKAVSVSKDDAKGDVTVIGADLKLSDLVPQTAGLPVFSRFAFDRAVLAGRTVTVTGKIGPSSVAVTFDRDDKSYTAASSGLKLADFIPSSSSLPVLDRFALKSVSHSGTKTTVSGTIDGKTVSAAMEDPSDDAGKDSFTLTGADLKLVDLLPQTAGLPILSRFAFQSLSRAPPAITVNGTVGGKAVAVKVDPATKLYSVTSPDLKASDFFPEAASMPVLAKFAFESLSQSASGLVMTGRIDGKLVTVRRDAAGKNLVVSSDGLKLSDLIPEAAGLPLLDRFAFTGYSRSAASVTVTGTIDDKVVSVSKDDAQGGVTVTGADLKADDFVPQASGLPVLSRFAFDRAVLAGKLVTVAGEIGAVSASVTLNQADGSFALASAGLKLADVVPEASSVPVLDRFALKSVSRSGGKTSVAGTINDKDASVSAESDTGSFVITGSDLELADFVPEAAKVPLLDKLAFQSLTRTPVAVTVAGTINGKAVSVTVDAADKLPQVTGAGLGLDDFVPAASDVAFLQKFIFDKLGVSSATLTVSGRVNGKAVTVTVDRTSGYYSVTGSDLKASDVFPEAAAVPLLGRFALDSVQHSAEGLAVTGKVDDKAVTLRRDASGKSLTVTGERLKLTDFIPQAAGTPLFDRFAFTNLSRSPAAVTVTGTIGNKAVSVSKDDAKADVLVTGADLKLVDLVPTAANLPFLKVFAFDSLDCSDTGISVDGKVNGKAVSVRTRRNAGSYSVTGQDLKVSDFFPGAAGLPALDKFAFESLTQTGQDVLATGRIDGKAVSVHKDATGSLVVTSDGLKLTDFIPQAAGLPLLDRFAFTGYTRSASIVTVTGTIDGKPVSVSRDDVKNEVTVVGAGLKLSDFVPAASNLPVLSKFALDKVVVAGKVVTVAGKIGTAAAAVSLDQVEKSFTVTSAGLKLSDVIPEAAAIPALDQFALKSVARSGAKTVVAGALGTRSVSVAVASDGQPFTVTGADLKVGDFVPAAANLPLLKSFAFQSLTASKAQVAVTGAVDGKAVSVTMDPATKFYTVTGQDLKASDFIPQAAGVPLLSRFAFESLSQTASGLAVTGKVDGKAVSLRQDSAGKSLDVSGDDLRLSDFIPQAAGLPLLDRFAFTGFSRTGSSVTVSGTIDDKAVSVSKDDAKDETVVTGADLKLTDLVPAASDLPVLSKFAFVRAALSTALLAVNGKIDGIAVAVTLDRTDKSFTVVSAGLKLADFIPETASLPVLNEFTLKSVSRGGTKTSVTGAISGKNASVSVDSGKDSFIVTGDNLTLASFIPETSKVPLLDKFAFQSLSRSPAALSVTGTVNGKAVSVAQSYADKTLQVKGADLKLADFVPAVSGVPFLNEFAFDLLDISSAALTVGGRISGKTVTVRRGLADDPSFTATGDALKLSDVVPETAGLKAFDRLSLSLVAVSPAEIRVNGAINDKGVRFLKTRGPQSKVTVTADDLTLADIFDPLTGVPVINAVAMDKLTLDGTSVEVEAKLNGDLIDVIGHVKPAPGDEYTAVFFKTLDAATFIPSAQGHAANSIALKSALFIVQSQNAPARTVTAADLPGDLPSLVGWAKDDTLRLSAGVNFAAQLDITASGGIASALKTAGIDALSLPLRGTLSPQAFKAMGGGSKGSAASLPEADKQSLLSGLNLSANAPLPKLPSLGGLVGVTGPVKLSLSGGAQSADSPWAKLPAALSASKPEGDLEISLQFGVDFLGAGIGKNLTALLSLDRGASTGFSLVALHDGTWEKPFGIPGLILSDCGFKFSLESSGGASTQDIAFFASGEIGGKKGVSVSGDFTRADGKLALDFFELDGTFTLRDLPGGKSIPSGDRFELDAIKLSRDGIEAKTTLAGRKTDAFLFDAGAGGAANWTFAIDQKNFKITELLPIAAGVKVLDALTIPSAALIITENGLNGTRASFGVIARDMFDDIFGKSNVSVSIPGGIGLVADFDPASMGILGKGLSKIGVHDDAIIMGEITGVFQGSPGLRLSFAMAEAGNPSGLPPKAMNYKPGVLPSFFVLWGGEDVEAGLKIPVLVKAGKDLLELSSSIELEFSPEGLGIKIVGAMDGAWHQPFGIAGISLSNLKMDAAINDAGDVQLGFAGEEQFGRCADPKSSDCLDLDLAVSLKFLAEAAMPDGVAFAGKANQLGIPALLDVAETLMKVPGQLSKLPVPYFNIKNAKLAFTTPGATDPDLGLVNEGFAFAGTFNFMGQDLGSITGAGGPTSGITFKGKISDIDLEVLKFKNNDVDISINLDPKFIINSDVNLLGGTQRVKLDIEPPHFEFDIVEKLGVFGDADLTIRLDGFDLQKGTFDKTADISVVGEFKSALEPWLEAEIKKGVEELRQSANAKLEADSAALRDAQAKVDKINDQIAQVKAEDDKVKARAQASLDSVESRVNSLQGTYDHEISEAHHCGSRWTHWACSPGWYIAAGATYVSLKAAQGVLEAAKAAVAAAFDLDPRLIGLYAERDIATAALTIASAVVEATEEVENFVLKELENILEAAVSHLPFEVDQAILLGDLRDMIAKNDPLILDLKFKIAGAPMREYFAVKVPDTPANAAFDAEAFALLPAIALDKLTESALSKVSSAVATWVHSHIASKLAEAEDRVRQQVEAEEARYKDVLATMENGSAKYKKAFADQAAIHAALVAQTELSDLMGPSLEYTNTYLAIGHSRHCLGVSKDGLNVIQEPCKDGDAERWSTGKLDDGYVFLKSEGLCLRARKGDSADGNEPLILGQCDKDDKRQQWKVITNDGFYDKIVNRDAQKCLHFNKENANPNTAFAIWTSCMGTDSQNFRDIPDAERPTWHPVNTEVKAGNGLCLAVVDPPTGPFTPKPNDKEAKLFARPCDDKSERFNYTEMVNGDIKLVHTETGACIYPQKDTDHLAIRPCDEGKDMLWRVNPKGGSADQLFNPRANLCMMLPAPPKNSTQALEAVLAPCNTVPDDGLLIDFIK
ncbi:MAG: ricin-type beta-trefoil lectin domain protein [Elusimicrobia bacterium]|nr:ricin-type beta-trefoil lectin domain protein [Elusimicrobiota bacterium]